VNLRSIILDFSDEVNTVAGSLKGERFMRSEEKPEYACRVFKREEKLRVRGGEKMKGARSE
jgi:hypothetical protein